MHFLLFIFNCNILFKIKVPKYLFSMFGTFLTLHLFGFFTIPASKTKPLLMSTPINLSFLIFLSSSFYAFLKLVKMFKYSVTIFCFFNIWINFCIWPNYSECVRLSCGCDFWLRIYIRIYHKNIVYFKYYYL